MAKHALHALLILLILLILSAPPSMAQDSRLIVLSPHWEGIQYEFQWAFQDYYREKTGKHVDFTWLDVGGTSEILRFVRAEFDRQPSGINIDLFFGGGVEPYEELSRLGFLHRLELNDSIRQNIPREIGGVRLTGPDNSWVAPVLGTFGILCNSKVLQLLNLPTPGTWEDLVQPEWHSWVASTDPRKSGSAHMIYEIILQAYGWEKGWQVLFGLGRNIRSFGAQSNQPAKDVEAGEVACAFAYDTQAWWAQQKFGETAMPFVLPAGLTVLAPDAVGILKGAPNLKEASAFVEFLMSPEGQRLWITPKGAPGGPHRYDLARMPAMPAIYSEPSEKLVHFNPFEWPGSFKLDPDKAARRWNILNDLLGTFLIDAHPALRETAFNADRPDIPTEGEILVLADKWQDPWQREEVLRKWSAESLIATGKTGETGWILLSLPWAVAIFLLIAAQLIKTRRIRRISAMKSRSFTPGK